MSQLLIQQYLNELSDLRRVSGTSRESVVREAFKDLIKGWGRSRDLIFVPEYEYITATKDRRQVDGALLHALRVPLGYWEAKDEKDDLDEEIKYKFRRGYPQENIIFDDSHTAVLIQNRQEVMRCNVEDVTSLERLLGLFFEYERPEIAEFRKAVEQFKADLPTVLAALRGMIETAEHDNPSFREAATKFLKHAQETINPNVTAADVREMLIQHILTEETFSQVFDNSDFHRQNNVARELYALEGTFFTGGLKRKTLEGLKPYYAAIRSAAALVSSHHEKQAFLKVIYENFYKVYNKKAADRLGVIYTPNEIVRFMVEGADWLCQKHFGKRLIDRNVEILDPAAGTGTFIVELIEHFRGQPAKLRYKYLEELHANEVAILPYYVANLNIEASYASVTSEYEEFPNLCFVDTLDNVAGLRTHAIKEGQHFGDLLGAVSEENVARIKRQNKRRISVVIGNPPYNANQLNENENNKNREYPAIDRRIKETYIAASTARKTKRYDMYSRFYRWASDRVEENGIVAFITNRNFIDAKEADGFRSAVAGEFNDIYVIDLGGDVRDDPRISGTKHNVFGIQTGVAIGFMVKRAKVKGCRIRYGCRPPLETADEKLAFISNSKLEAISLEEIKPDARHNWINLGAEDFGSLVPIADKRNKSVNVTAQERSIFKLFSLGVSTNRDEWLIDFSIKGLAHKAEWLSRTYNGVPADTDEFGTEIKWSENLKRRLAQGRRESFDGTRVRLTLYRPFVERFLYDSPLFVDRRGACDKVFSRDYNDNIALCLLSGDRQAFSLIATSIVPNLNLYTADATTYFPLRRLGKGGWVDNLTDWALGRFRAYYETSSNTPKRAITKDAIFHYVYGILHDPVYRERYALNLKREFPGLPFYADFWQWADWGRTLIALHVGYKMVEPWPLERVDVLDEESHKAGLTPKVLLRANKSAGNIELDSETQLTGIPAQAWNYRLGNRSGLEWILDQYKEKTPRDATIRERFNTYRFTDHKEKVIDLLKRVTRVSLETMKIIEAMRTANNLR